MPNRQSDGQDKGKMGSKDHFYLIMGSRFFLHLCCSALWVVIRSAFKDWPHVGLCQFSNPDVLIQNVLTFVLKTFTSGCSRCSIFWTLWLNRQETCAELWWLWGAGGWESRFPGFYLSPFSPSAPNSCGLHDCTQDCFFHLGVGVTPYAWTGSWSTAKSHVCHEVIGQTEDYSMSDNFILLHGWGFKMTQSGGQNTALVSRSFLP